MRVHHLNAATLCPASARLVNGRGGLFERARLVCHVLVVETSTGLLLVDTGLGRDDLATPSRLGRTWLRQVSPRLDQAEPVVAQLARIGATANDVRAIVLTHLDLDHAGGIADFPRATIHVHTRELEAASQGLGTRSNVRYVHDQWRHGPIWSTFEDGNDRWFGFEGVRTLGETKDEVLLVPLRGHSTGHTGVALRSCDRWLLHAGDGYFFHGQVETPPHAPRILRAFQRRSDVDTAARAANQERLRALVESHEDEVTLFCAHDALEFDRLRGDLQTQPE
ncbi:MBL fold metallo-hydrolase [Labilithrix luteola]|nr:MBL fold metallo-hydrolase [Labilithrix luteola]